MALKMFINNAGFTLYKSVFLSSIVLYILALNVSASSAWSPWEHSIIDAVTDTQTKKWTAPQSLDVDSSGQVHLVWRTASYNPTDFRVFYATNSLGGFWSPPIAISGQGANSPALAVSASNAPYVSFEEGEEEQSEIYLAYFVDDEWQKEQITQNHQFDRFSSIDIDLWGHIHLAWITRDSTTEEQKLTYALGSDGNWEIQILTECENPFSPYLSVSPQGITHIVYRGGYPPEYHIHHSWNDSLGSSTWNYEVLTSGNYADLLASLVIEEDGDLHLAVGGHGPDFALDPREIYYLYKHNGGDWLPAEFVASYAYGPSLDVDENGAPHILWAEMDRYLPVLMTGNLFHSHKDEGGIWEPALAIGDDHFNASFKLDDEGYGHIGCSTGGNTRVYDIYHVKSGGRVTSVDPSFQYHGEPSSFRLLQNYPNPFNQFTEIGYDLPVDCPVRLEIFNVLGQRIRTLVDADQTAGYKRVLWDGLDERGDEIASGIYLCRLKAGEAVFRGKFVLLR